MIERPIEDVFLPPRDQYRVIWRTPFSAPTSEAQTPVESFTTAVNCAKQFQEQGHIVIRIEHGNEQWSWPLVQPQSTPPVSIEESDEEMPLREMLEGYISIAALSLMGEDLLVSELKKRISALADVIEELYDASSKV